MFVCVVCGWVTNWDIPQGFQLGFQLGDHFMCSSWRSPSGDSNEIAKSELVGGIPTPLKNMKVNWDTIIPNREESKHFQEPIDWRCPPYMFGLCFRPMSGNIPTEYGLISHSTIWDFRTLEFPLKQEFMIILKATYHRQGGSSTTMWTLPSGNDWKCVLITIWPLK